METNNPLIIEGRLGQREIYALSTIFHLCGCTAVFGTHHDEEIEVRYSEQMVESDRRNVMDKKRAFFWQNREEPKFREIQGLLLPVGSKDYKRLQLYEEQCR